MSGDDDTDLVESWIEVTPQILGYQPYDSNNDGNTNPPYTTTQLDPPSIDLGSFHTNVEQMLLSRLLSEAQELPDLGLTQVAPPSPPPSRECLTPAERVDPSNRQYLPPDALLYAAALKASSLSTPVTTGPGEWASRPEIGGFLPVVDQQEATDSTSSSEKFGQVALCSTWSIRHSSLMKSRFIAWLIDHVPNFLSHAATFLLGAATMLFLLRKRIKWPKAWTQLPLD